MINMRKADENMDQSDEQESSNVEEESTRIKKQKMKEKILEKVSVDELRTAVNKGIIVTIFFLFSLKIVTLETQFHFSLICPSIHLSMYLKLVLTYQCMLMRNNGELESQVIS